MGSLLTAPAFLPQPLPKLLIFGGKGGVGKTTISAATAVYLAKHNQGLRITAASSDPAHSLGDVLCLELTGSPIPVPGLLNLSAFHINAVSRWQEFIKRHRSGISQLLSDGVELDPPDVERVLQFSIPGLDEIMALLEVEQISRSGSSDVVVVDTAPWGHTMRLLELPDTLPSWLNFLNSLMDKQRYIASRFGHRRETDADRFVREMLEDLRRIRTLLRDRARCRFTPVMVADTVVAEETERLMSYLNKLRIPVTHIVVNRYKDTATTQQVITDLQSTLPQVEFVRYPIHHEEIIGAEKLLRFIENSSGALASDLAPARAVTTTRPLSFPRPQSPVRVILIAGKGGVGKSTIASGIALAIRRGTSAKDKILLYSTDPARSLADLLQIPIGHNPVELSDYPGLWAQQADPFRSLEELKKVPREEVEQLFKGIMDEMSLDLPFDRKALRAILDLVPPGLDEAMALADLSQYLIEDRFRMFVIDTAPTGHLLRLLHTPDLAQQWLRFILELFIKRGLSLRLPRTNEMILNLTRRLEKLNEVLTSAKTCHAVIVTTSEKVVLAETGRLAKNLESMSIQPRTVVLNMVSPKDDSNAIRQGREILPKLFKSTALLVVHLQPDEPRGVNSLAALITC